MGHFGSLAYEDKIPSTSITAEIDFDERTVQLPVFTLDDDDAGTTSKKTPPSSGQKRLRPDSEIRKSNFEFEDENDYMDTRQSESEPDEDHHDDRDSNSNTCDNDDAEDTDDEDANQKILDRLAEDTKQKGKAKKGAVTSTRKQITQKKVESTPPPKKAKTPIKKKKTK